MSGCGSVKSANKSTGKLVLSEAEVADSFWKRFRGLMLRRKFPRGGALLFKFKKPGRYSIHMFFMWFPIDLVYLDSSFRVVETRERLKPWRVYRPKNKAQCLLELPEGTTSRLKIKIGQKISL
jgi:hypothetical protein